MKKEFTLRSKIEHDKAEYQKQYGNLGWRWTDEGLPYAIQDYHSSIGSVMDFTEDDWRTCKEYGWTLDEVCELCGERRFCEDVDNLELYVHAVRNDNNGFLELSSWDAIVLVKDFYIWREELLPVVKEVYSNG